MTAKIQIAKVVVHRVEGPSNECVKKEFVGLGALTEAHRQMLRWSYSAPKDGGYDKCDFTVTFADGYVYQGLFDLTCTGRNISGNSVGEQMFQFMEFVAGKRRPAVWSDATYAAVMKRHEHMKVDATRFLETYELGMLD